MITVILAFVVCLGVLIFAHEFGHFIVAKAIGIRVEKFSLGFGPQIPGLGFKRGDTQYMISALPLGGYVKMAGENPDEKLEGQPWEFASRAPFERMKVVFSGPLMNLVLAVILMSSVFFIGRKIPAYLTTPPVIGWVREDSPALRAGLLAGDKIVSINGHTIHDWEGLQTFIVGNVGSELHLTIERNQQVITLTAVPDEMGDMGLGTLGIDHPIPARIGSLTEGYPAQKSNLKAGDLITAVNGLPVVHWYDMAHEIHEHPGEMILLTIQRDGTELSIEVTPILDPETQQGLIGITPQEDTVIRKYGFWPSLQKGVSESIKQGKLTFEFLFKLIRGKTSPKALGGPIMIAQVAGASARAGLSDFLFFMAFLSLQLGILNLFPIPVLDGGHLLFFFIEMLVGRPISIKKQEIAQQLGFGVLILLMVYVFYNDIMRFFVH